MTATKGIKFEGRFFWAYDVAAGVFLKYLIDEAEASEQADETWLSDAVSHWRVQAAITECGLTLEEHWSSNQRQIFIELAEAACKKLATRESIAAKEIASWPDERIAHFTSQRNGSSHSANHRTGPCNYRVGVWNFAATIQRGGMVLWNTDWPLDDPNEWG